MTTHVTYNDIIILIILIIYNYTLLYTHGRARIYIYTQTVEGRDYYPCNMPATNSTGGLRAAGGAGQPCLWFSQGCSIGCETCDNHTQHTNGLSLCNSSMKPTLPKEAWTMNLWAVEGSANDSYRTNPWRAPGFAPVVDACGMAGGRHPTDPAGGDAVFATVPWAKLGDLGTDVLPRGPSVAFWKRGSTVDVAWAIRFNHGGGYQYRLCPVDETLTEACFQAHTLNFADNSTTLVFNNGSSIHVPAVTVSGDLVHPAGSQWRRNPIPRIDFDSTSSGQPKGWTGCDMPAKGMACRQFEPPCHEQMYGDYPWHDTPNKSTHHNVDVQGDCSGDLTLASMVDRIVVPEHIAPGEWTLGFRWDCEETAQIWSSCADITIV